MKKFLKFLVVFFVSFTLFSVLCWAWFSFLLSPSINDWITNEFQPKVGEDPIYAAVGRMLGFAALPLIAFFFLSAYSGGFVWEKTEKMKLSRLAAIPAYVLIMLLSCVGASFFRRVMQDFGLVTPASSGLIGIILGALISAGAALLVMESRSRYDSLRKEETHAGA